MLNFRNSLVIFLIAIVLISAIGFFMPVSRWIYIGIVIALVVLLTWGSISIQSGFYLRSVCSGNPNTKSVAFTFDDGPDEKITPVILDILKDNNVKGTFFIVGSKAEKLPEIIKRIDAEGHLIGGHSYSHHFFFDLFSYKTMREEMAKTSAVVFRATGKKMKLFRPPYGVTNPTVARVVKATHSIPVGWSLKSKDTVLKDETLMLNRLVSNLKQGDIILFHDNKPLLINTLRAFIPYLKEREYVIERLDNFINCEAYVT